jgi:hypothetical protein
LQIKQFATGLKEGLKELKEIKEMVIRDNVRLDDHIKNKQIHTYERRGDERL